MTDDVRLADFDYDLPPDRIAQHPLEPRDASRLLVVDRRTGRFLHRTVRDLPSLLDPGDLLVANNTRVLPARLHGVRADTGGKVELLLLRKESDGTWAALARPVKKLPSGSAITVPPRSDAPAGAASLTILVEERLTGGEVRVRLPDEGRVTLADYGETPLPPYIRAPLTDAERYQTVYASVSGSAAAPTAGLHVTPRLLDELRSHGIEWSELTLHVGLDTFRPVEVDDPRQHHIHREWCEVPVGTVAAVSAARGRGNRVVAVGTTAARTLETLGRDRPALGPGAFTAMTDLFILPGHRWRVVDGLLTNFHLPKSTLLMMVSSLASRELILRAYREAMAEGYRFYSFGDAMLIL